MRFLYPKDEKLKSRKTIERLFLEGNSVKVYPLKLFYLPVADGSGQKTKMAVSVSKRNFKRAVDRNRVKRILRECYRLNQELLKKNHSKNYVFLLLYVNKELPDFEALMKTTAKLFLKFSENSTQNTTV